jgi:hypothetical protein
LILAVALDVRLRFAPSKNPAPIRMRRPLASALRITVLEGKAGAPSKRKGERMARFISGTVFGVMLGISVSAYAAGIFGTGTLTGWTVTKDGEEVCSEPTVDVGTKEIECD